MDVDDKQAIGAIFGVDDNEHTCGKKDIRGACSSVSEAHRRIAVGWLTFHTTIQDNRFRNLQNREKKRVRPGRAPLKLYKVATGQIYRSERRDRPLDSTGAAGHFREFLLRSSFDWKEHHLGSPRPRSRFHGIKSGEMQIPVSSIVESHRN